MKMAKKNSKNISDEIKEESVTKPESENALEERVKCLETIVKNYAERIAKLEANAPKRLTSADFVGM
jgi:hypothetical protein